MHAPSPISDPRPFTIDGITISTYAELYEYVRDKVATAAQGTKLCHAMLKTNTQNDTVFCLGHITGDFPPAEAARYQHLLGVRHPYLGAFEIDGEPITINAIMYQGATLGKRARMSEMERILSQQGMIRIKDGEKI